LLGGMTQMAYEGTTDLTPYRGAGWGAAIGLLGAGTMAIWAKVSPSRVLLVDMGAGLGTLAGAAAASPLVFEDLTPGKTRWFLAATAGGAIAGGLVAWFLTRDKSPHTASSGWKWGLPTAGIIGASATPSGAVPAYGLGWQGRF
jgi:hypothetical protein